MVNNNVNMFFSVQVKLGKNLKPENPKKKKKSEIISREELTRIYPAGELEEL